jgi:endonuclease III
MKTAAAARAILVRLGQQHPNADTELDYSNAFELLVATILSAQTTDVGVNEVTPALFARYPDATALAAADPADVEAIVKRTGFFRQKTKSIVGMSRALVAGHGGQVPPRMEDLVKLPGVGRKTANVVLGHALGVPGLPVDRHVLRVSNRIGLAESDDPEVVEQQLCKALPGETWTVASDTLILHGRRICMPKPDCDHCTVRDDCDAFRQGLAATPRRPATAKAAAKKGTSDSAKSAASKRPAGSIGPSVGRRRRPRR